MEKAWGNGFATPHPRASMPLDQQDPEASRNWQLGRARALIEPVGGVIVEEFFDIGLSRSIPWQRRP